MTQAPRFIMIGGFLGAGKTTTIARLAAQFRSAGQRVVIVTNDQASDLVDTLFLRTQGFDVGEVAGSCFCCNFDELTRTVESLGESARPDVILAEPVGSCTDLVATVIRPLEQVYDQRFRIAPYGVIIKPSHGFKILGESSKEPGTDGTELNGSLTGGFSPKAEYIFRKQIEEADFVILNRADELSSERLDQLTANLAAQYPGMPVVRMSAKTGMGFDALHAIIDGPGAVGSRAMEVDYDTYAEGEAELGWLNCQVEVRAASAIDVDRFLIGLLQRLQAALAAIGAEVAHLKAIAIADGGQAVANLVSSVGEPVLSLASESQANDINLVINARVGLDPDRLTAVVEQAISQQSDGVGARGKVISLQSFRPGRPVPTHRLV